MGAILDVFDAVIIDNETKEPIGTTTLQDAQIQTQVQTSNVVGGKGGNILGVIHSQRTFNITLTDVELNMDFLAKQFGQDIVVGKGIAYAMPEYYEVVAGSTDGEKKITLNKIPLETNNMLSIYDKNGDKLANTDFTLTGNDVNITATSVAVGDQIEVRTYKYETSQNAETVVFDGSVFAKGVTLILDTVEVDLSTEKPTHTIQYQFTNALPDGQFTISTQSTRQAVTNQMVLTVVKPATSDVVGKVIRDAIA